MSFLAPMMTPNLMGGRTCSYPLFLLNSFMRYSELIEDKETLKLPDLETGDELLVGKFKNRKATIKGFDTDENNQPVALTNKGSQKIFKPRVVKLMKDVDN